MNKGKKIAMITILMFVMVAIIGALGSPDKSTKADNTTSQGQAETARELSPKDKMRNQLNQMVSNGTVFAAGSYAKGDIPVGEYIFMPMIDDGKYYVEKDSSGNIIDNENFDSFGYVYVHGAGNLATDGALIPVSAMSQLSVNSPRGVYETLKGISGYKEAGYYKIGVDLPAGSYNFESYDNGYVSVVSGPVGKSEIIDNEIVNGSYTVNVSDGQYLKLSGGKIVE